MFNNANVIFRTKFVDGISAVMRTLGNAGRSVASTSSSASASASRTRAEEEDGAPKKRGKKANGQASARGRSVAVEDVENEY